MKPNKNIVILSFKLRLLGYMKQTIQGDWYLAGSDTPYLWKTKESIQTWNSVTPIPSVEDAIIWIEDNTDEGWPLISYLEGTWSCDIHFHKIGSIRSDALHEALLKAMVKILESIHENSGLLKENKCLTKNQLKKSQ